MSRREDNPRLREILDVFDELVRADDERHRRCGTRREDGCEGILDSFVHHEVIGNEAFDDWPADALREIVLAFARHAPPRQLRHLLQRVRRARAAFGEVLEQVIRDHEAAQEARVS